MNMFENSSICFFQSNETSRLQQPNGATAVNVVNPVATADTVMPPHLESRADTTARIDSTIATIENDSLSNFYVSFGFKLLFSIDCFCCCVLMLFDFLSC